MQGYGRYSGASPALARLLQYFRAFALAVALQQPWVSARGCENTGHGKSVAPAAEQRWGSGNLSATVYRQPRAVEKPRPFPALGRRLGPARCHRFNAPTAIGAFLPGVPRHRQPRAVEKPRPSPALGDVSDQREVSDPMPSSLLRECSRGIFPGIPVEALLARMTMVSVTTNHSNVDVSSLDGWCEAHLVAFFTSYSKTTKNKTAEMILVAFTCKSSRRSHGVWGTFLRGDFSAL